MLIVFAATTTLGLAMTEIVNLLNGAMRRLNAMSQLIAHRASCPAGLFRIAETDYDTRLTSSQSHY